MPGTVLTALCSSSFKIKITIQGRYNYSHFTAEAIMTLSLSNFLNVKKLVNNGVRVGTQVYPYLSICSLDCYSINTFLKKSWKGW